MYKALAPGAKPRFDTVLKVARALGVRLTAQPVATALPTVRLRRPMPLSKARLNNATLNELAQE